MIDDIINKQVEEFRKKFVRKDGYQTGVERIDGFVVPKDIEDFLRSTITDVQRENENKIIKMKSDIAHAIGYCRGFGHPETYLEKQYPELLSSTTPSKEG